MMFGDALAIMLAVLGALRLWSLTSGDPFDLEFVLWRGVWFVVLLVAWFILASANDYFNLRVTARTVTSLGRLARILLQLLILYVALFFFLPPDKLPRLFIFYYVLLSFMLIGTWRVWQPFLLGWSGFRRRALIIGTGRAAELIAQAVAEEAPHDYEIVGFVRSATDSNNRVDNLTPLGTGLNLVEAVGTYGVAELIVAYNNELPGDVFEGMMACYEKGITVVIMPLLYERITGRVPIEHIGQNYWSVVFSLENHPLSQRLYFLIKRLMDIVFSVLGLAAFGIVLAPIALLITLDSPGPIFYRQERVGRGGNCFVIHKLRTMHPDVERETGPRWTTDDDPRRTRVGKVLRKMRLDELPQLVNILRGEMSMIGPRPERPAFVAQLTEQIPFYRTRLVAKPGLTGWAQVCYRYASTSEEALHKLQYDLYYIRHQSIALDVQILLRTLAQVITFQGR